MAKQASNTATQGATVKLSAVDAARLAMKDVLKGTRMVDVVNSAGKTVATDANNPASWVELGAYAGAKEGEHDKRTTTLAEERKAALNIARILLKDAAAPVWNAFNQCFIAGAEGVPYQQPANLLHRWITAPLAAEGITKPISETSSNARKDAAGVTVAEKKKAAAETMAKLPDAELAKTIADVSTAPDRRVELLGEMQKREKAKAKEANAAIAEQKKAARKSLTSAIDMMTPAQCVTLLGFATAILAVEKDATALYQHCAKVLDRYDNAGAPKKGAKKTKH
jgi:hypothetical protein